MLARADCLPLCWIHVALALATGAPCLSVHARGTNDKALGCHRSVIPRG